MLGESRGESRERRSRHSAGAASRRTVIALLGTLVLLAGCARRQPRVVVVGLDGATFDLIMPWVEEGKLPVMAQLLKEGAHGDLAAPVPPSSPASWTSAITGVNPGKHGIYGFTRETEVKDGLRRPAGFYTSLDRSAEPIWSILRRARLRSGLINIPLTSPPDSVNGFMISGFPHPSMTRYAFPDSLRRELLDYRLDAYGKAPRPDHELEYLADLIDVRRRRLRVAVRLLAEKRVDLFWVVSTMTDRVQHYMWRHMDPASPAYDPAAPDSIRNAVLYTYQRADRTLGRILRRIDDQTTLLVISDHGFGPVHRKVMGEAVIRGIVAPGDPVEVHATDNFGAMYRVGFRHGPPYTAADSAAYEAARGRLIERLGALTDPDSGEKVIARVWRREEIYQGPRLQDAPDVVALERDGYLFLNWVPAPDAGRAVYPADENFFSAYHRSNGILIARGPGIVPGRTIEGARIIDITPTLLAIFRVPVPDNVDGTVLTQLFEPSWAKSHPVARQPAVAVVPRSSGTSASIEDQLRSVGYLR